MSVPSSILVIRLSSLGDVLMTLPAVRAIRDAYPLPSTRLTWLVEGSVGELLSHQGFIDEVIQFPRGAIQRSLRAGNLPEVIRELGPFVGKLRETEYDLVLDFHGIIKSAIFSNLVKGKRKVGFGRAYAKEKSHLFYTEHVGGGVKRFHKVERNMLFPRYLGINGPVPEVRLDVTSEAEAYIDRFFAGTRINTPIFAVNPFSSKGSRFKRWDIGRYGELIRQITGEGIARALVLWGPGEEEEARYLKEIGGDGAFLACPTSVPQLLALLKRVDMYIGGDTGMMHLAVFGGTPVLAIFGPTDHKINGPYGPAHRLVRRDLSCSPCKNKKCRDRYCLTEITVGEVFEAVLDLHNYGGRN
ncbi:MAG: Lipopolysaccharide heptosyltransferase 1 [Syntrophorhabdus sp. PtaU1.Bin002]|nr:MAG: Lipopolysaccharide heptosyltransferase 1 [Syntrophorhabdus sp. PtaU1.Bin002]